MGAAVRSLCNNGIHSIEIHEQKESSKKNRKGKGAGPVDNLSHATIQTPKTTPSTQRLCIWWRNLQGKWGSSQKDTIGPLATLLSTKWSNNLRQGSKNGNFKFDFTWFYHVLTVNIHFLKFVGKLLVAPLLPISKTNVQYLYIRIAPFQPELRIKRLYIQHHL